MVILTVSDGFEESLVASSRVGGHEVWLMGNLGTWESPAANQDVGPSKSQVAQFPLLLGWCQHRLRNGGKVGCCPRS
jgi:hypothetical protein